MKPRPADHGFSLLELAISLAVAAVFLAILLPALSTARVSTHRARCAGNQRLLGEAWTHCLEDGGGALPMIAVQPGWRYGGVRFSSVDTAPFLDFARPLNRYLPVDRLDVPPVEIFSCPADRGITDEYGEVGTGRRTAYRSFGTSYRANSLLFDARLAGLDPVPRGVRLSEITTPASRLGVLGDPAWYEALAKTGRMASWHGKTHAGNILFLDGSVRYMALEPRPKVGPAVVEPVLTSAAVGNDD